MSFMCKIGYVEKKLNSPTYWTKTGLREFYPYFPIPVIKKRENYGSIKKSRFFNKLIIKNILNQQI